MWGFLLSQESPWDWRLKCWTSYPNDKFRTGLKPQTSPLVFGLYWDHSDASKLPSCHGIPALTIAQWQPTSAYNRIHKDGCQPNNNIYGLANLEVAWVVSRFWFPRPHGLMALIPSYIAVPLMARLRRSRGTSRSRASNIGIGSEDLASFWAATGPQEDFLLVFSVVRVFKGVPNLGCGIYRNY